MILSYLQGIIGVIFAFSVAIFVHELGHFMFAKLFGVRVETFSIGFGKRLWGFRRGDTEYKIAAIPFGGYVKMVGTLSKELEDVLEGKKEVTEDEKEAAIEAAEELSAPASVSLAEGIQDEVNALRNKPYWQKLLVFSAGCINNILTAILIYFLVSWIGYNAPPAPAAVIGQVDAISEQVSPLQVNDRIVSVGGEPVKDYEDFIKWYGQKKAPEDFSGPVPVEVLRDGTTVSLELASAPPVEPVLPLDQITAIGDVPVETVDEVVEEATKLVIKETTGTVAVTMTTDGGTSTIQAPPIAAAGPWWPALSYRPSGPARIEMVLPNLPAEKAGLKNGDIILSINDTPVSTSQQATSMFRKMAGQEAKLVVERAKGRKDVENHTVTVEVRQNPDRPEFGQIGAVFGGQRTEFVKLPFGQALKKAFSSVGGTITAYINAIQEIFGSSFKTIRENLAGPIGISVQFFKTAQSGLFNFFITFALFNIVLAITNLLPLPVLDGGHILFATIEAIIRRPLPAKVMVAIYNLFTFLIIALALMITFNDLIMNAWRLPFLGGK